MKALNCIPINAHDCFTRANELFSRGHYLDAQTLYDRACDLDPTNTAYAEARDKLRVLAFAFFKKGIASGRLASNTAECFGSCCEGCCEGLCEGGCEICCEGICSNCDCG